MTFCRSVALAFIVLVFAASSQAALLYDISNSAQGTAFLFGGNWGVSFTVTTPTATAALGLWDEGSNGLAGSHQVGLWSDDLINHTSSLIASTTITNSSSIVPSTASNGRWLFNNLISAVSMPAGTYTLGYENAAGDSFRGQATTNFTSDTAYLSSEADANDPTFGEPGGGSNGNPQGYFGPNLSTTTIPEPSFLGVAGLAGMAMILRRRRIAER